MAGILTNTNYKLDDQPLHFRENKTAAILLSAFMIIVTTMGVVFLLYTGHGQLKQFYNVYSLIYPIFVIAGIRTLYVSFKYTDTLTLDKTGITCNMHGVTRRYPWGDISDVRSVIADERSGATAVSIKRKGELTYNPKLGLIWGFPIATDNLIEVIRDGIARWGSSK